MLALVDVPALHLLGFVGLLLIAASWQFNDRRRILLLNVLAFLLFATELFFLQAYVGSLMMLFACAIALGAVVDVQRWLKLLLIAIPVAIGALMAEAPHDWLPIIAHVTGAIAFFSHGIDRMRRWSPVGTVLWAVHNVIVGAWGQFFADLFILGSMALGAYRHRRD